MHRKTEYTVLKYSIFFFQIVTICKITLFKNYDNYHRFAKFTNKVGKRFAFQIVKRVMVLRNQHMKVKINKSLLVAYFITWEECSGFAKSNAL